MAKKRLRGLSNVESCLWKRFT